jgi:hypothetical protein
MIAAKRVKEFALSLEKSPFDATWLPAITLVRESGWEKRPTIRTISLSICFLLL